MAFKEIKFKNGARVFVKEGSDCIIFVRDPGAENAEGIVCGDEKELCPMILGFLDNFMKTMYPANRPMLISGIAEIMEKNSDGFCEMMIVKKDEHHD